MTSSTEAWRAQAACRKTPVEEMFPHENAREHTADLLERCNTWCPVKAECLAFADLHENTYRGVHGIWGGLTPRERIARRAGQQEVVACSTPGRKRSVERHYQKGQKLCPPCQQWQDNRDAEQARWAEVRQLIRDGVNDHRICWMAGVHKDTVKRLRAEMAVC